MRRSLFLALTLFSLLSPLCLWAQQGKKSKVELLDDRELSTSDLRRRVRSLQEAVIDLQARVDQLEARVGVTTATGTLAPAAAATPITCYVETPFDGLFDATEVNETKARVEAVKACMAKVKSRIHCSAEKVKCGN